MPNNKKNHKNFNIYENHIDANNNTMIMIFKKMEL